MDRKLDLTSLRAYLAFPFQDRDATNRFLVGAALYIAASVVPLLPIIPALGYQYQVMRRVIEGERPGMPDWHDWGRLFMDGLKMLLIGGVYLLPGILVTFAGVGVYFLSIFTMIGSGNNPDSVMGLVWFFSMMLMFLGMTVGMVLSLLGWLPMPFATAHAVARDDVLAAFRVRQWWRVLQRVRGDYLTGWVVFFGLVGILYTVYMLLYMTIILCLALPLVLGALSFYMFLVGSAIFAAIYREGAEAAGEPLGPGVPAPAQPGAAPHLEPAAGEMIAVETAAATAADLPLPSQPEPPASALPGEEPQLAPAASEMIAIDVASETAEDSRAADLPAEAANVAQVFAAELPSARPDDPTATVAVDRSALLAGSLPDEAPPVDLPLHTQVFDLPEEAGDPNATRRLPPETGEAGGDTGE